MMMMMGVLLFFFRDGISDQTNFPDGNESKRAKNWDWHSHKTKCVCLKLSHFILGYYFLVSLETHSKLSKVICLSKAPSYPPQFDTQVADKCLYVTPTFQIG